MTSITVQDGQIVLREGAIGTEQACCCGEPPECESDEDCPEGECCVDGQCGPCPCESDEDCPEGEKCCDGECVPADTCCGPCDEENPCPEECVCVDEQCYTACPCTTSIPQPKVEVEITLPDTGCPGGTYNTTLLLELGGLGIAGEWAKCETIVVSESVSLRAVAKLSCLDESRFQLALGFFTFPCNANLFTCAIDNSYVGFDIDRAVDSVLQDDGCSYPEEGVEISLDSQDGGSFNNIAPEDVPGVSLKGILSRA